MAALLTALQLSALLLLAPSPAAAAHRRHPTGDGVIISEADYQGLQAIKHSLTDPLNVLQSWNATGLNGACSGLWAGIKCVNGSVVAISLPWRSLSGTLSARGLGQLVALRRLSLHDNAIAGQIPTSLGFLPDLRGLYLFHNRFSGAVPVELGRCLLLQSFDASSNLLTGGVPAAIANSTKLIRLNLSRNALSGEIPAEVAASSSLLFLDLSWNKLSGAIPDAFADSSSTSSSDRKELAIAGSGNHQLVFLDLSHNAVSGPLPESLAGLPKLQTLDLSANKLNGSVPPSFGNLTGGLKAFNVSYNDLAGAVPASLAQKFGAEAFAGNLLLCGYSASSPPCPESPPSSPAPAEEQNGSHGRKFSPRELALIIAGIVIGVLVLLCLCCLLLCLLSRKKKSSPSSARARSGGKQQQASSAASKDAAGRGEKPGSEAAESGGEVGGKLVHFDGPLAFTADDLLCATAEIMGKSTYGTVYKATLEDGSLVAVKRLREKITKGHKEFEAEAAALGKLRHRNLLSLRAYYLGPKGEKLLVFDFIPQGSLSAFLHARAPNTAVNWAARMGIAKGTARGLAYLHDEASIVHGNLTASNVLLDDGEPKIADVGLSRLMTAAANSSVLAAAGALGYRAPELSKLKKASAKTDVYSLGVILLELLTGKSPADTTNGMDLPQWVGSIVKEEWTSEVFDLELMRDAAAGGGQEGDELMDTLKLALQCVEASPAARPEAREVLRQLEEIRPGSAPEAAGRSEEGGHGDVASASNE